ncbi:MAG: hypothetical protein ABI778_00675 [Ignavibacteriota bacterium]
MQKHSNGNKSSHILVTSSNLLGFCLIVLTSLKVTKYSETTIIDEATGICCIILMFCSLLSFLAIRETNSEKSNRFETIADYSFILALFTLSVICIAIAFSFIF